MSNISQFDVGTAALEHLQLLNNSNRNPLEIAAQFRTLLRSKKSNKNVESSSTDYTYMDYITTDATIRRRERRSNSLVDHRSKIFGKIQYNLDENQSSSESHSTSNHSKCTNTNNSVEDIYPINSHLNEQINHQINSNLSSNSIKYPTINWKKLRNKQYENKLNKIKEFISTKSILEKDSYSIRTPSISPNNSRRLNYTISKLNSTLINHNNDDIFFPIADCNLIIKHKSIEQMDRISYF